MKLNKEQLNELLYYITYDDFKNSLIFKLQYIYGRNAREVLELKVKDIDLTYETITFTTPTTPVKFPLNQNISEDLIGYIYDQELKNNDYVFKTPAGESTEMFIKRLNYYLDTTVTSLNKTLELDYPKITTKDFKILRGQHLFLDGVKIQTIHELYHNTNMKSTKTNINYQELKKLQYTCNNVDEIFQNLTDLNLYYDKHFEETEIFTVSDDKGSIIIEIDYPAGEVNIISDEDNPLNQKLQLINMDILIDELKHLKKPGQYKLINDLRFLKN